MTQTLQTPFRRRRTVITALTGETVVCWLSHPSWEMVQDVTAEHFGVRFEDVDLVEPSEAEFEAGFDGDKVLVRGEHVATLTVEWR